MKIEPAYTSVGSLFNGSSTFFIPKYQRAYAWDYESVSDFIKDLRKCFSGNKSQSPINHFFGGILSIKHSVTGTFDRHSYEVIDGQQRIVTFTLLASCLIEAYKKMKEETTNSGDTKNGGIIQGRIDKLYQRFIEFNQEVQREVTRVEVLKLSRADRLFYRGLICRREPQPSRDSHEKMLNAYSRIDRVIQEIVDRHSRIEGKIDDLEILQNILDKDCTILHMVTDNKDDAFRLFQVINDRGTNLTDGDLLRTKTLELLEGFKDEQYDVERMWDDILADKPSDTNNYLNWIYESYQGSRSPTNALYDMFLDKFFPQHQSTQLTSDDALKINSTMKDIHKDILNCRKLVEGQWLYPVQQPITSWDRTRLHMLLVALGHTLSIPLFLAAYQLDHKLFSEIVQIIERLFFRYKVVCNQHVTPLKNIYYQEALAIRENPNSYDLSSIRTKLQKLIDKKASDSTFENALNTLEYKESGGSNQPLRYFLMTVEYYYQWYKRGANGTPVCVDKSRVYDFAGTSIEHIYPRNADESAFDSSLEPLKNTLGNLTIMDPAQNTIGGNESFAIKQPLYEQSSVELTKEIGAKKTWTQTEINAHNNFLIDAALAIFRP